MSAPPNGLPNGSKRPPGAPPLRRRKPASANPMVARKRPVPPPPPSTKPATSSNKNKGGQKPVDNNSHNFYGITAPKVDLKTQEEWKVRRRQNGGWWDPPPQADDFREIPVYITKKDIKEGLRLHAMRFSKTRTSGVVDIMDPAQFPRPVTLHRKDARDVHQPLDAKDASASPAPVDDAEAERIANIKAEKEAQRAQDQAQIAPVTREAQARKPATKPEKMETKTFYAKRSAERQKENNLRYEESLPWVIEDADGKSVYVSQYLGPLSESMVALQFEGSAVRAVPVEKFCKFTHKPPFKAYSIEEAEALMKKQMVPGRWSMRQDEKDKVREEENATRQFLYGRSMVKMESSTFRSAARSEKQEHDDIDFSGDEFQDDDENPTFERDNNDEEEKDSKERIRREQLGANLFGEADEHEIEQELRREEAEEEARKRLGKSLTKHLVKLEKHLEYKEDPDDSSDLDVESSSDEENDPEKQEVKLENENQKLLDPKAKAPNGPQPGTKTKSGADGKKVNSLKRPGSPNLSEMESSGNESSRKRPKKSATGSFRDSRASTPVPGSQRLKKAPGAASDGEATGAEMSDGSRPKKIKNLPVGSHSRGTPVASRAGSPAPGSGSQSPNRAGSPSTPNPASGSGQPITAEDLTAVLQAHPEGLTIGQLHKAFTGRVTDRQLFISLVKNNARWGTDKKLRVKN